ncbi:unnamed protein product, partial [Cladocopium goreaui]
MKHMFFKTQRHLVERRCGKMSHSVSTYDVCLVGEALDILIADCELGVVDLDWKMVGRVAAKRLSQMTKKSLASVNPRLDFTRGDPKPTGTFSPGAEGFRGLRGLRQQQTTAAEPMLSKTSIQRPALSLTQAMDLTEGDLCDKYMDPKTFRTYLGGVAESTELLARKWDHIFYTGNGVIGRIVTWSRL